MTFNSYFFPGCDSCSSEKREILFHVKLTVLIVLTTNADSTVTAIILGILYKNSIWMILHCNFLIVSIYHILNDFLSVDSGQPLSGWCVSQIHFTKKGLRFLYQWSDFRLQPWPGTIAITAFLAFCSWRCYDYFVRGSYPVPAHERTSAAQATAHAKCRKCQKGLYLCGAALYNRLR